MSHESDSLNSQVVEAQGAESRAVKPVAPERRPALLKLRQQLVEAGLIPADSSPPATTDTTDGNTHHG